jgi:hypothetical protein
MLFLAGAAFCLVGIACGLPHDQAADDLRRYGDLLASSYAWAALQRSVDVDELVAEAVSGLPAGDVDLEVLHEAIWRIQAQFMDSGAQVALPREACDPVACVCSGVSLASLRGHVYQAQGIDGYAYAFTICGEIPHAAVPLACRVDGAAAVRWNTLTSGHCSVLGSTGVSDGMSSSKTDAGLTMSYSFNSSHCCDDPLSRCDSSFEIEITAGEVSATAPIQSRGCYYHTRMTANVSALDEEALFAPFLVYETSPDVFVALRPDRSNWIDVEHPVLRAIDGVPITEWVSAAEALTGQRRRAVRLLNDVWRLRKLRELREAVHVTRTSEVTLELGTLDGVAAVRSVSLAGVPFRPSFGDQLEAWPRKVMPHNDTIGAQILPGTNVGYLRIPTMEDLPDSSVPHPTRSLGLRTVLQAMGADETGNPPGVFATDALVIDVRGNFGGGSREIVQALVPFFMSNVDRRNCPLIGSASAALKSRGLNAEWGRSGYLEAGVSGPHLSDTEAAIARFNQSFAPTGVDSENVSQVLQHKFSAVEYMPIPSRLFLQAEGSRMNGNDWYHYANPVIVLQDEDSQGAVEIFLAAMKSLSKIAPNVRLMGQKSGGAVASAGMFNVTTGESFSESEHYTLPNSKISVRLAATAAFMPMGNDATYSGHGVTPNIEFKIIPSPNSLLVDQPDEMLNAALSELTTMSPGSRSAISCDRGKFPSYEDQTGQVCYRAYGAAFDSTAQGYCRRKSCTSSCQESYTHMLRSCANDTYEEIVQYYYSQYPVVRGFNTRAVPALSIMGPSNCDYSMLSDSTRCNPSCSVRNVANGTDQRWVDLRKCLGVETRKGSSGGEPLHVPVWNPDSCASAGCEEQFHALMSDCRACDADIQFAFFLNVAVKNLVDCREQVANCDSVVEIVRDACCAGVDCASDGYPTICSYGIAGRHSYGSLCQEAVKEAAEEKCPLSFLNNSRLQGLYMVSLSSLRATGNHITSHHITSHHITSQHCAP